jgi:hypothetical protein
MMETEVRQFLSVNGAPRRIVETTDPVLEKAWRTYDHQYMTCRNHVGMLYLTKNPWERSVHIVRFDRDVMAETGQIECDCSFSDLVVLVDGDPWDGELI